MPCLVSCDGVFLIDSLYNKSMRALMILIFLVAMIGFAVMGMTYGPSTVYSLGFLFCLVVLVASIGSLGSKQGGGKLNKTRRQQF